MDCTLKSFFASLAIAFLFCFCQSPQKKMDPALSIQWELLENTFGPKAKHIAKLTIKNRGDKDLEGPWELHFNTLFMGRDSKTMDEKGELIHLEGDYFKLHPNPKNQVLKAGGKWEISYQSNRFFQKNTHAPQGLFLLVGESKQYVAIENYEVKGHSLEYLSKYPEAKDVWLPTAEQLFSQNEDLQKLDSKEWIGIIPSPKSWAYAEDSLTLGPEISILHDERFVDEAQRVKDQLQQAFSGAIQLSSKVDKGKKYDIKLSFDERVTDKEGYNLSIDPKEGIKIQASDAKGIFYGIQSLFSLIPAKKHLESTALLTFRSLRIQDEPRFSYRGLHLDVARNFQPKASVLKLIDLMAYYKLNTLHFNLSNDEAWRIEIPELPELTDFGSQRGYNQEEKKFLWPYYGSGPDHDRKPDSSGSFSQGWGSGYYSQQDFIDILQYAAKRHIEIIPEIGFPGHARAAILAMRGRYHRLMEEGKQKEAEAYLLEDLDDQSTYRSVQDFTENTVNPCQESTFAFIEKTIDVLAGYYQKAGLSLKTFHTGGDEVPNGVWTESPLCEQVVQKNPELKGKHELANYFLDRLSQLFEEKGLQLAGWEEIGQLIEHREDGHVSKPNPRFSEKGFQVYAWNSVVGWGGEDMAYQLANEGYSVVICNSSNLYFDLAYDLDPDEPGHSWSGFVDTYRSWRLAPFNHFISNEKNMYGKPIDMDEMAKSKISLSEEGKRNIKGIQGQTWTETIKGPQMLEYFLFPKMLGLVERAWAPDPEWTSIKNKDQREKALRKDWNRFANVLGQKEFEKLEVLFGGVHFRLAKPGLQLKDGELSVNTAFPGLPVYFAPEGQDFDQHSKLYQGPIKADQAFVFKTYSPALTRSSLASHWRKND